MGHGHQHPSAPSGAPASARHRGRLATALGLLAALAVVETAVALTTGSLALLSDAGHVAVDVFGLAMTLAAIGAAVLIVPRAVGLARAALRVLLEAAPPGVDLAGVAAALGELPGVLEVHDLHVWTVTSGMEAATAHLTVAADARPGAVLASA